MAGLNGKHGTLLGFQDGVDVADQEPAARVADLEITQVPVETGDGALGIVAELGQQGADLGQAHLGSPQHRDQLGGADLVG